MKKMTFLLLTGLCIMVHAQYQRFIYEYTYAPDSLHADRTKTENMVLEIGPKGSEFMSWHKKVRDSLLVQNAHNIMNLMASGGGNASALEPGNVTYSVEKEYTSGKTYIYEMVGTYLYKISEDDKPVWKILPEKKKILNYDAQKATTRFGGRQWTAWFTTQLPFQDGPYIFRGLPGLIIAIEDGTHTHRMELAGHHKIGEIFKKEVEGFQPYQGIVNVTKSKFGKVWKEYIKDPAKDIKSAEGSVKSFSNGREDNGTNSLIRSIEKRVSEAEKRYNNKIEPSLYQ